jgi:hypothetical protein
MLQLKGIVAYLEVFLLNHIRVIHGRQQIQRYVAVPLSFHEFVKRIII